MYSSDDDFLFPNGKYTLSERLDLLHAYLLHKWDFIDRIAVALYDSKTDHIKTYAHSTHGTAPIENFHVRMRDVPSLKAIAETGEPRVVGAIPEVYTGNKDYSKKIVKHGYQSSYTMPLIKGDRLYGFLFLNSYKENSFNSDNVAALEAYLALVAYFVSTELATLKILSGSISTLNCVSNYRDPETGAHLSRMSHYAHLIARSVALKYNLSDEFVEHILLFAPLHDLGKVGIPDRILIKKGKLTAEEFDVMKEHTVLGVKIVKQMIDDMDLNHLPYIDSLMNIIELHHEKEDGSGYPKGLKGDAIPIEAKIAAIADVFDALTSIRPYKKAWSNEEALAWMSGEGRPLFLPDLVDVLYQEIEEVQRIQEEFGEDQYG